MGPLRSSKMAFAVTAGVVAMTYSRGSRIPPGHTSTAVKVVACPVHKNAVSADASGFLCEHGGVGHYVCPACGQDLGPEPSHPAGQGCSKA